MRRVMDLCSTIYNSPVFLNFVFQSFRISFRPVSLHGFVISYIHSFFHGRFTPRRAGYLTMKYFWRPRMKGSEPPVKKEWMKDETNKSRDRQAKILRRQTPNFHKTIIGEIVNNAMKWVWLFWHPQNFTYKHFLPHCHISKKGYIVLFFPYPSATM